MKYLAILLPLLGGNASPILPDLSGLLDLGFPWIHPTPDPTPGSVPTPDPDPVIQNYTLIWHDEFTPASGREYLPASTNWLFDTGTSYPSGAPAWGNNELQTYTTSRENIQITKSGTLQIIPRYSPNDENGQGEGEGGSQEWTSARIETSETFSAPTNGKLYIEARLRTGCAPASQQSGIWPAFWALGESFRDDPTYWPMASEWDFMEVINGQATVYNTLHCGRDSSEGGPCGEYTGLGNGGVEWSGCEWHVVGFEVDRSPIDGGGRGRGWKDETLRWFVDGQQTHLVSGGDVGDEEVWERVAHQGHFLLLNVAVGGNWPGYPDERTVDGERVAMEVDYVRVYTAKLNIAAQP
ncbi:concanavalin A-like lectin/glucanase domain-containing protein [Aspergillus unguis]